jgi:hypothetical protein
VRERVNNYFGYSAVGAVRIVQRPFPARAEPPPAPEPDPALVSRLEERLAPLDAPLRDSLRALGRAILARS